MTVEQLQSLLETERRHAAATFLLDEALGFHHGLSWSDFVLLEHLSGEDDEVLEARVATKMGVMRSRLLMRTRPLEKLGIICRSAGTEGRRMRLSSSGRRLLGEARETAARVSSRLP